MNIWIIRASPDWGRKLSPRGYSTVEEMLAQIRRLTNGRQTFGISIIWRHSPRPVPPAQLVLSVEGFDADYFESDGCFFVSERLRQVMALGPETVKYLDVDASGSTPLVRSKNYKILAPLAEEDDVVYWPPPPDDLGDHALTVDWAERGVRVRPDAVPKHELFTHKGLGSNLLCTDALAQRVLEAGCTGVRFHHPRYHHRPRMIFRTLRGLEEPLGWDEVNDVEITGPFEPGDEEDL